MENIRKRDYVTESKSERGRQALLEAWLGMQRYTASAEERPVLSGSSALCGKGRECARQPDPQQTFKHDVDVNLCRISKYIQAASLASSLLARRGMDLNGLYGSFQSRKSYDSVTHTITQFTLFMTKPTAHCQLLNQCCPGSYRPGWL